MMGQAKPFHYQVDVFYEDTDAAGMVYHANYLKFMERARTIFLRGRGIKVSETADKYNVQFLVRAVNVLYEKPARLEQSLTVVTKITKLGKASVQFEQKIYLDPYQADSLVCTGEVVVVCVNLNTKPCAIPESIMKELKE